MMTPESMDRELNLLIRHVVGSTDPRQRERLVTIYRDYCRGEFSGSSSSPFSLFLARFAIRGRLSLLLADVWTRLFDPKNPIRYKLNAMTAFCECDPRFASHFVINSGGPVCSWLRIVSIVFLYIATLIASLLVIGGLYTFRKAALR